MIHRVIKKLSYSGIQYGSVVFFIFDLLRNSNPDLAGRKTIDYHIINSTQDQWLKTLCDTYPAKHFHLRLTQDCQQCYIVIVKDQLAASAWLAKSSTHVSEINFNFPVEPGDFYIYDCYVKPEFRGFGIYNAMLIKIISDLKRLRQSDCYQAAYIGAEPGNSSSIRTIKRVGFEEFACIRHLHLGRFSRWYGVSDFIQRKKFLISDSRLGVISD